MVGWVSTSKLRLKGFKVPGERSVKSAAIRMNVPDWMQLWKLARYWVRALRKCRPLAVVAEATMIAGIIAVSLPNPIAGSEMDDIRHREMSNMGQLETYSEPLVLRI
jgi:hypothetical protein